MEKGGKEKVFPLLHAVRRRLLKVFEMMINDSDEMGWMMLMMMMMIMLVIMPPCWYHVWYQKAIKCKAKVIRFSFFCSIPILRCVQAPVDVCLLERSTRLDQHFF